MLRGASLNPYDPPAADSGRRTQTVSDARLQTLRTWARRIGWVNIACAPGLILLVTCYHLYDDSSVAGVLWVLSFPAAIVGYVIPGVVLMLLPRAGWVLQLLPLALSWYAAYLLQHLLRVG